MPSRGNPKLTVHLPEGMREDFVAACPPAERGRESGAAKVVRDFVAWYLHHPGAKMPRRPPRKGRQPKVGHEGPPDPESGR